MKWSQKIIHAQNSRTASHIQHNLILEQVLVLVDSIPVRFGANLVFEHLLVDALNGGKEVSVWIEEAGRKGASTMVVVTARLSVKVTPFPVRKVPVEIVNFSCIHACRVHGHGSRIAVNYC